MSGGGSLTTKGLVVGGDGVRYRMRGYDNSLTRIVYWTTAFVDSVGTEYTGPGPLIDIVVSNVIGTAT